MITQLITFCLFFRILHFVILIIISHSTAFLLLLSTNSPHFFDASLNSTTNSTLRGVVSAVEQLQISLPATLWMCERIYIFYAL